MGVVLSQLGEKLNVDLSQIDAEAQRVSNAHWRETFRTSEAGKSLVFEEVPQTAEKMETGEGDAIEGGADGKMVGNTFVPPSATSLSTQELAEMVLRTQEGEEEEEIMRDETNSEGDLLVMQNNATGQSTEETTNSFVTAGMELDEYELSGNEEEAGASTEAKPQRVTATKAKEPANQKKKTVIKTTITKNLKAKQKKDPTSTDEEKANPWVDEDDQEMHSAESVKQQPKQQEHPKEIKEDKNATSRKAKELANSKKKNVITHLQKKAVGNLCESIKKDHRYVGVRSAITRSAERARERLAEKKAKAEKEAELRETKVEDAEQVNNADDAPKQEATQEQPHSPMSQEEMERRLKELLLQEEENAPQRT
jgi:hypothetical protein